VLDANDLTQVFMFGFYGAHMCADLSRWIELTSPGGVILFSRNSGTPTEVASLVRGLQEAADGAGRPPLLVACDQEGGEVTRLSKGFSPIGPNMALGAIYRHNPKRALDLAYMRATLVAAELGKCGVSMNLAPCLDLSCDAANSVIGTRSYSDSAEVVAELGIAHVLGHKCESVFSTAKHFPGHGATSVDSHFELARTQSAGVHVEPYARVIGMGVEAVMSAHVVYEQHDRLPATLSEYWLSRWLRQTLGFGGLVLTDCMNMKSISDTYGIAEACVMALRAGADMVLVSHEPKVQEECVVRLRTAVETGELDAAVLRAKVDRILSHKARIPSSVLEPSGELMPSEQVEAEISRECITLLRKQFTPHFGMGQPLVLLPQEADEARSALDARGLGAMMYPKEVPLSLADEAVAHAPWVLFFSRGLHLEPSRARFAERISKMCDNFALVSMGAPYDLAYVPEAGYALACYSRKRQYVEAALDVVFGVHEPCGRLPIRVPGIFEPAAGMEE